MFRLVLLSLCIARAAWAWAAVPQQQDHPDFVGVKACAGCHRQQFQDWRRSHHDLSMQEAREESVLGNFDNAEFIYNGTVSRFYRRGTEFWVETDGPAGTPQEFRVEFVFGVYPLQQYLLALSGGRLNALGIAWDSRPTEEGGQRWFHLYPDQPITAGDPLHWSGHYQNWNSRCAECHSTNLQKNFDARRQRFNTTWSELDIACEACHGPGRNHLEQARRGRWDEGGQFGLPVDLRGRTQWVFEAGQAIAQAIPAPERSRQVDSCGRCHSRRGSLGEYQYNRHLLDTHRLSLLEEPLYHPDGQILDEVYVYGSFTQSKMYQAGVVCSDCHNPHSNALRAPGNGVCAGCHRAGVYDSEKHHRHPLNSSGALCANCHMPETTYMAVDPRRDHAMRVPRPDLSVVMGTPNACNQCHADKEAEWALQAVRGWGIEYDDTGTHPARALAQARRGDARAIPGLRAVARAPKAPAINRATAMVALGQFAGREAYQSALQLLQSADPLLRLAAVRSLEFLPAQQRLRVLNPHIVDPSKAVRMETARLLADIPAGQPDPPGQKLLANLLAEYLAVLTDNADMPGTQLQLGIFHTAQRRWQEAEAAYRQALTINPQFVPALLNMADLYRSSGRDADGRELLQRAIAIAPDQPDVWHALGLLETRTGNRERALASLKKAAGLERGGVRHRYVYAIALHDSGDIAGAIDQLRNIHRAVPENRDILVALVNYCRAAGRMDEARRYAARLRAMPDNPPFN